MTGAFYLDWAILSVSVFNTILLCWLGLTVLLTAEHRRPGLWLAGGSLLLGSVFFVSHTAIVGLGFETLGEGMDFWWHVGWVPAIALPFAWYAVTLWYSGFWDDRRTDLHRRHRLVFLAALGLTLGLIGLLVLANPLPSFSQPAPLEINPGRAALLGDLPALVLAFPLSIVLSIGASLDALRQPGPTMRWMGSLARQRARPWLAATSLALLAVSLLVAGVMGWVVVSAHGRSVAQLYRDLAGSLGWFDLAIAALISAATVFVGQAVVAYEIFTGVPLPRQGLAQQWRNALLLAAGCAVLSGWALTLHLRPLYSLLLVAVLLAVLTALFGWQSHAERERFIRQLRPFAASQQLLNQLLDPAGPLPDINAAELFTVLCRDVLGARRAQLAALGPLAPLVGAPLCFPDDGAPPVDWSAVRAALHGVTGPAAALDPADFGGAVWAVPLWSERGVIGVLLLGEKADGGLYAQEEMEIARASGERLIDTAAAAALARQLLALQRQRLAETQVLDQRARRILHDDVLPQLHAALLALNAPAAAPEAVDLLAGAHHRIADLLREMPGAAAPDAARAGLFSALRKVVNAEWGQNFDGVTWDVAPEVEQAAAALPPLTAEVLFHAAREAVRNAARYGRSEQHPRPLHLRVAASGRAALQVVIEDDGAGLSAARNASGGAGQGLALHGALMAVVGGTLEVESGPDGGARVTLTLPRLDS